MCMLGGGLIGTASNLIKPESSWIKNTWGYGLSFLITLGLAFVEAMMTKDYLYRIKQGMTLRSVYLLMLTPILHLYWYWGLYYGAQNLIQSHA